MKKYILCFILLVTSGIFAQAPDKMSYQAVIRDASDVLITNTTVGMQISILEGSPTGTEVYVETHTPTTNDNGLVSLEIGDGTVVLGDFSSIIWGTGSYYLKTETDPAGGTSYSIEGTSQLLSVPYAFYANSTAPMSGNTLDEAYDQEGGGAPAARTINVDDGRIELDATGSVAFSIISDPAFSGAVINGFGGGALNLDVEAGGDALDIDVAATGDKGITVSHLGTGHGLEILSTNGANASNAVEVFYNGTSNAVSVTSGGGADGIDVTYGGTAEAIHSVVTAGGTGNGLKILNGGTGDAAYIDNSVGTGDDGLQIDQLALGEAIEINIGGAGAIGNGIIINNDGAPSKSLEINNTNPTGTATAIKVDNAGTAKGLELFNGNPANPSEAVKITQAGAGTGLLLESVGPGKGVHIFKDGGIETALLVNTPGIGNVAMFNTDENNFNDFSTIVANNMGKGSVADFITTDEPVGKVNIKPTVNIVSNGLGVGINIDIINDLLGFPDGNLEPALFARHMGNGSAGYFTNVNAESFVPSVEIINGGSGAGLHIDCFGGTLPLIDHALHVEQSNTTTLTTSGYAAFFELKSPGTSADSAVKISSVATSAGSSALRVIPADPTKLAAVFEGKVEVATDILIGGTMTAAAKAFKIDHPLDPTNMYLVHNSIESNERINIYSGNITTNAEGFATVMLPDYMCALNTDFKYQLTIVDKSFAQAIIWEPMNTETNSFIIKTNTPEITVSWQITGTRQDTWAKENPMKVEVEKPKDF